MKVGPVHVAACVWGSGSVFVCECMCVCVFVRVLLRVCARVIVYVCVFEFVRVFTSLCGVGHINMTSPKLMISLPLLLK
jgi:hypothetical protein